MTAFKGRGVVQLTGRNSLEDEQISRVAKAMQEEIDRELMATFEASDLRAKGWMQSPVARPWGPFHNWSSETAEWCHLHCTGDYRFVLNHWYFERPSDATAFTLRWTV